MDGSCPLSNKNLRLALNYALDRNAYVDALGSEDVTAISRYVLPILPGLTKLLVKNIHWKRSLSMETRKRHPTI